MKKSLGYLLLLISIAFSFYGIYLSRLRSFPIPVQASENEREVITAEPSELIIPSLNIQLPVFTSRINGNKWETVTDGVSYLVTSPTPGEQGNSVIYGHNWPNLLGSLKNIQPGDKIIIKFGSKEVIYLVHYLSRVSPTQSGIYGNTTDYRLTLYTCIGLFDQERLVVTAFLQN